MVRNHVMLLCVILISVSLLPSQTGLLEGLGEDQQKEPQEFLPPYRAQVKGTGLEAAIDPSAYIVGPGDRFLVSILGSESRLELVTVTPTGELVVPGIGFISVTGKSAEDVTEEVMTSVHDMLPTSDASCTLYGIREIRVSVSGAIRRPGFHEVTPLYRVSDILDIAGRVLPSAALHRVKLLRVSDEDRILDLNSYYYNGDLSHNPTLEAGDRLIVPFGDLTKDLVLIRGLGTSTIYHTIMPGENLAEMVMRIQLGRDADLYSVTLHRQQESGSPIQRIIPAEDYPSVPLHPGDILYFNILEDISVVGEVRRPGRMTYQPGLTAREYVTLAGGVTREGSARKVEITRVTGQNLVGGDVDIQAGDTIYVPRSFNSVFLGQLGVVQAALTFLNIYLAFLAASSR